MKRRGRPPWTQKQIRQSLNDSQVLPVVHSLRRSAEALVSAGAFAIIAAIESAAPKDFISLKP
jgi:hypothetical protein